MISISQKKGGVGQRKGLEENEFLKGKEKSMTWIGNCYRLYDKRKYMPTETIAPFRSHRCMSTFVNQTAVVVVVVVHVTTHRLFEATETYCTILW